MKAPNPVSPTLLQLLRTNQRRKMAAQKARDTKRRRYKETSEWIHPLGKMFHGFAKKDL